MECGAASWSIWLWEHLFLFCLLGKYPSPDRRSGWCSVRQLRL